MYNTALFVKFLYELTNLPSSAHSQEHMVNMIEALLSTVPEEQNGKISSQCITGKLYSVLFVMIQRLI